VPTALITGATAGLGAAFARKLAGEGYDLVLVARNTDRLAATRARLRTEQIIDVETMTADLSTEAGCAGVVDRLGDRDHPVDLLVNNAGMGLGAGFSDGPAENSLRLTRLNVVAVLRLAHAALGPMRARGSGDIINVSSVAGFTPATKNAAYSASKAWVTSFSESLHAHHAGTGVRVLALCPGLVHTEFHQRAGLDMSRVPHWLWTDADDVVGDALRALRRGQSICVPGRQNQAIVGATRFIPRRLLERAAVRVGSRTT